MRNGCLTRKVKGHLNLVAELDSVAAKPDQANLVPYVNHTLSLEDAYATVQWRVFGEKHRMPLIMQLEI